MKPTQLLLIALLTVLPACGSSRSTIAPPRGQRSPAPAPSMISHIVFFELRDASDYHELLHDCDWMLGTIPSVSTYAAGKHLETGRSSVSADYHLALALGFDSEQDLGVYVNHPQHIAFVDKWMPRLTALRVYDMLDWPTTRYGVR